MKKHLHMAAWPFLIVLAVTGCRTGNPAISDLKLRPLRDTIGFAQYSWQVDSIMARIIRGGWKLTHTSECKMVICPHDDYTYVGALYPEVLSGISANNLILLGVAHPAQKMGIEDSLVFGSYSMWKGPWGNVGVSEAGKEIFDLLRNNCAIINDSLQKAEHSLESMVPYLQYFNRNISIIPILVPSMKPERMKECGKQLAGAISEVAAKHGWTWGRDFAIVATTDAVHYGNEDWGGADYAFYGCDKAGNKRALNHEEEIVSNCFSGQVSPEKIALFNRYTLDSADYHKYKWTWCGRYSIPVAMYTGYFLNSSTPLTGEVKGYSTSITGKHIPVDDLGMGRTAIATDCHWVGYAAVCLR